SWPPLTYARRGAARPGSADAAPAATTEGAPNSNKMTAAVPQRRRRATDEMCIFSRCGVFHTERHHSCILPLYASVEGREHGVEAGGEDARVHAHAPPS